MPEFTSFQQIAIPSGGGTYTMPNRERIDTYIFTGSGTLSASYDITADLSNALTVGKPNRVKVIYNGQWTLNGNNITIFGAALNQEQAIRGNLIADCLYNGSAWLVTLIDSDNNQPPNYEGVKTTTLTNVGGTITLVPGIDKQWQEYNGNAVLAGSWVITGSAAAGQFYVHYTGTLTPGVNNVTIFGLQLTQSQIVNGNVFVFAYYDVTNSVWRSQLIAQPNDIDFNGTTNTTAVTGVGVTLTLQDLISTQFQRLTGSGALGGNVLVNSTGTFRDGATFYILYDATADVGIFSVDILGQVLTATQALYGQMLVIAVYDAGTSTWRTQLLQSPNTQISNIQESIIVPVSFESGEQALNRVFSAYKGTISLVFATVTKAIAATDAAAITVLINGVATTGGALSFAASTAINATTQANISAVNAIVPGDFISIQSTKTTPGGKALVTLIISRTP